MVSVRKHYGMPLLDKINDQSSRTKQTHWYTGWHYFPWNKYTFPNNPIVQTNNMLDVLSQLIDGKGKELDAAITSMKNIIVNLKEVRGGQLNTHLSEAAWMSSSCRNLQTSAHVHG